VTGPAKVFPVTDTQMVLAIVRKIMAGDAVNLAIDEFYPALLRKQNRLEFFTSIGWRILLIVRMGFAQKTYRHAIGGGFGNCIVMA